MISVCYIEAPAHWKSLEEELKKKKNSECRSFSDSNEEKVDQTSASLKWNVSNLPPSTWE